MPDSWIYDPKTGKAAIAIEYEGLGGISDIERPGNRALISRVVTRGNTNLALHDLDSHREILLTPHEGPAIAYGELAHDGSAAYIVHNVGRDRLVVAHCNRCKWQARRDDATWRATTQRRTPSRSPTMGVVSAHLESRRSHGARTGVIAGWQAHPVACTAGRSGLDQRHTASGDRMLLNVTGAVQPSSSWQYDFATRRYRRAARDSNVELSTPGRPEPRKYKAQDGSERRAGCICRRISRSQVQ